jgi:hypothetical protein
MPGTNGRILPTTSAKHKRTLEGWADLQPLRSVEQRQQIARLSRNVGTGFSPANHPLLTRP